DGAARQSKDRAPAAIFGRADQDASGGRNLHRRRLAGDLGIGIDKAGVLDSRLVDLRGIPDADRMRLLHLGAVGKGRGVVLARVEDLAVLRKRTEHEDASRLRESVFSLRLGKGQDVAAVLHVKMKLSALETILTSYIHDSDARRVGKCLA